MAEILLDLAMEGFGAAILFLGAILLPFFSAGFILRLLDQAAKARKQNLRSRFLQLVVFDADPFRHLDATAK